MGVSIWLVNSRFERLEIVYDPQEVLLKLRETAVRQGADGDLANLRAIDPYGDAVFNWLQVDRLVREVRRAATINETPPGADELIHELERLRDAVISRRLLLRFIGD